MNRPCLIVCERRGLWAAALRRNLGGDLRVRETRGLADCRGELAAAPASLAVVEFTAANLDEVLALLTELPRQWPLAALVGVCQRGLEHFEPLVREAGAVHVCHSPREAGAIARMAVRHAARAPAPRSSFTSQIWDSLPWYEAAAT